MKHFFTPNAVDKLGINIRTHSYIHPENQSNFALAYSAIWQGKAANNIILQALMYTGISLRNFNQTGFSYLFAFLFMFSYVPSQAQQLKQEDPLAPLFKVKKVKSITAYQQGASSSEQIKSYYKEFNTNGQLVMELVYAEDGKVVKKYQGIYTTDYRIAKEIWVQDDTDSVTYKYKNGKIAEESWYWGADKSKTRVIHFFDTLGHKVCTVSKNNWGVYIDSFFYQNNRVLQAKNYNEHGLLNSTVENTYDTKGRIVKTILVDEHGTTMQTTTTLYAETGPIKSFETVLYAAPNKTKITTVAASMAENYKYDTQKQLKEVNIQSYTNNELLVNNKSIYTYGDKGLPTSQTVQNIATSTKQVFRFNYTFF